MYFCSNKKSVLALENVPIFCLFSDDDAIAIKRKRPYVLEIVSEIQTSMMYHTVNTQKVCDKILLLEPYF